MSAPGFPPTSSSKCGTSYRVHHHSPWPTVLKICQHRPCPWTMLLAHQLCLLIPHPRCHQFRISLPRRHRSVDPKVLGVHLPPQCLAHQPPLRSTIRFQYCRHHHLTQSRCHHPIKASQVQSCHRRNRLCLLSVKRMKSCCQPPQVAQIQPRHHHYRRHLCLQLTSSRRPLKTVQDQSHSQCLHLRVLLPSQLQNVCPCLPALDLFSHLQPYGCCHR